jgi:hypothetical protein
MSTNDKPVAVFRPRFRDVALASGLLTAAQIDDVEAEVGRECNSAAMPTGDWDRALAAVCVDRRRWLTAFQSREMLAGRCRFRLGQYTVTDEIGKGGMGQVFKAEHAMMGREVAIKVLPRAKANPESEAAFRREMRMLGRLDHENLVRAYDAGYDAQVYYLVTELVPGLDLKQHVQARGPLDETQAASVIVQAARGLAYAHAQGLVHRDVKPGNILVMQNGRVKVLDLGLAGSQLEEESLRVGRVVGTMDYIAPEQIRAPDDVGPSADIYALGCTAYFAVTGRVPFPGGTRKEKMARHLHENPEPLGRLAPQLSPEFCAVVEEMMEKSITRRITTAAEVVDRLGRFLPELPAAGQGWPAAGAAGASVATPDVMATVAVQIRRFIAAASATPWVRDLTRLLTRSLVIAVIGGLAVGGFMSIVKQISTNQPDQGWGFPDPSTLGRGAFLLLLAVQLFVPASDRGRR